MSGRLLSLFGDDDEHDEDDAPETAEALAPSPHADLDASDREFRRAERHLRAVNARPTPLVRLPTYVPLVRGLVRAGLFRVARDSDTSSEFEVANGIVRVSAERLTWLDARALLVLGGLAAVNPPAVQPTQYLPKGRLAHYALGRRNEEAARAAAESLDRMVSARFSLRLAGMFEVGEADRPTERLLDRVDGDEDSYRLRPWLRRALEAGGDRRSGLVQTAIRYDVAAKLSYLTLLLYLYLECERFERATTDPTGTRAACGFERLVFAEPLLRVLDLHRAEPKERNRRLREAMRVICARDSRYRAFRLKPGKGGQPAELHVYRARVARLDGHLFYSGRLCPHCRARDWHGSGQCCCRAPQPCRRRDCARCG